jgi:hypothetical protein
MIREIFIGIGLISLLIITLILFVIFIPILVPDRVYTQYFEIIDNSAIEKAGTNEINSIINESIASENDTNRLNKIADLMTNNYDDKVVGPRPPELPFSKRYLHNENGQIWIIPVDIEFDPYVASVSRKLASDPNWLIYQKFGACREVSLLFYHIANKSGFSSRIVRTGDGQDSYGRAAAHWWNEVELGGVNKTFDVQWYLQIKNKISPGSKWSGNRSDYINNSDGFSPEWLCSKGGAWITDNQGREIEDITNDYMGSYNCSRSLAHAL